jgi:hypothetical protein
MPWLLPSRKEEQVAAAFGGSLSNDDAPASAHDGQRIRTKPLGKLNQRPISAGVRMPPREGDNLRHHVGRQATFDLPQDCPGQKHRT